MRECNRFKKERHIFHRIKDLLEKDDNINYKAEFEKAIKKLVESYDTRNHENRFVVGGALEVLFCSLLKALKFECKWLKLRRYDLEIDRRNFSIKSSFTDRGSIRLINVLGEGDVDWEEPTMFFIGGQGLFYADPCMDLPLERKQDALTVKVKDVLKVGEVWSVKVDVPLKPKSVSGTRIASYDVARAVLEQIGSTLLKEHLPEQF